jgi:Ca2+-binding RTX toxin-like protein
MTENNVLDGGFYGADTMIGGLGNDTYNVDHAGCVVKENAGEGVDTVYSTVSYTLGDNVENLTLGNDAFDVVTLPNGNTAYVYGDPTAWAPYLDWSQGDNSEAL